MPVTACPNCKQCDQGFELLCDEPGCNVVARCEGPTGDHEDEWGGYRNTCRKHMQPNPQLTAAEGERSNAALGEPRA